MWQQYLLLPKFDAKQIKDKTSPHIYVGIMLQINDTSLLTLTSTLEPEECFQLLFCTLATEKVQIDSDVENIHKLVTSKPGKYREAHKFGKTGKECSIRYKCAMKATEMVQFYQSY
eukprot:GFUD01047424.1.p2 GENE.GFUD01047424.1~~GFUD01047424.1.p2  ORF type:complete len:116 (+),score=41.38 GFUD01047424.1:118-465(+)